MKLGSSSEPVATTFATQAVFSPNLSSGYSHNKGDEFKTQSHSTKSVYRQGFDFGSMSSWRPQESKDFRFSMVDLYKLPERYGGER